MNTDWLTSRKQSVSNAKSLSQARIRKATFGLRRIGFAESAISNECEIKEKKKENYRWGTDFIYVGFEG